jgi:hypothetical protein
MTIKLLHYTDYIISEKLLPGSTIRIQMKKYLRFILGVRKFFKGQIQPQQALEIAKKTLRNRILHREENFLNLVEKGIFGYSKSPYLELLTNKKIKYSNIKKWVEKDGIEITLNELEKEGVYFTVDEFKGKTDVIRNGLRFRCKERDFDNPFLSPAYEVRSGATRSAGTRIRIDFDYLVQRSFYDAFILNIHEALISPIANWFPVFPGAPGINSSLRFSHIGNQPKKWFSQVDKAQVKINWEKKWGTNYIMFMSKFFGVPLAKPEYANLNYAFKVAEWASAMLDNHPNCVIYTFASSAVRVCMAANENKLNLKGTRFLVTGETLTPQKKEEIEATGARAIPVYGISEAGVIAAGCNNNFDESDHCHTLKDTIAITSHKIKVPYFEKVVDSFLFTTILYESPKLLLNVGMGDYGKEEIKQCNCEFGNLGFDTHISNIKSYEKLTGEGVTFIDSDFIRIIEKDLPSKFGGKSTDYQLIEEEDSKGLNHLRLLISPRLNDIDEKVVVKEFIKLLRFSESSPESWAQSGSEMWTQARTVRIKRDYPIHTSSGKIFPFHISKSTSKEI